MLFRSADVANRLDVDMERLHDQVISLGETTDPVVPATPQPASLGADGLMPFPTPRALLEAFRSTPAV